MQSIAVMHAAKIEKTEDKLSTEKVSAKNKGFIDISGISKTKLLVGLYVQALTFDPSISPDADQMCSQATKMIEERRTAGIERVYAFDDVDLGYGKVLLSIDISGNFC